LDLSLIEWLRDLSIPALITMTKSDKLSKNKMTQALLLTAKILSIDPEEICTFSAHTGEGKKQLWQEILYLLNVP
jgi:GTP-binding protein